MNEEAIFNKDLFSTLLNKARGKRSINQFANETGVSAAHISRFSRCLLNAPPSPETISKLSSKAHGGVSYKDLMVAAGHIDVAEPVDDEENSTVPSHGQWPIISESPLERIRQMTLLESKFFQIILSHLYKSDYKWSIQKPEGKHLFPDMTIDIEHDGYTRWYLEFKGSLSERFRFSSLPHPVYGQIALMELAPTDKFTIAVNTQANFNQFLKRPPKALRANLYVMLVDLEKGKIVSEEKLCDY